MAGFETAKAELDALGVSVIAASADPEDKAKEVADEVSFRVGFGVTPDIAAAVGGWWNDARGIIQPSEFLITADGKVASATYSSGPIGRVDAADVVRLINFREKRR